MLAVQYGVEQCAAAIEGQAMMMATEMTSMEMKETIEEVMPTNGPTLTADKLLETAIKDTCILSEESDESDSGEDMTDDQSASDDKDSIGKRTRSSMYARKSEPPVARKRKKLVFTLEYLESKLNRKLNDEEAARLKDYIHKGQNTKIFDMLVGGGKDQVWKCHYCSEEIHGSPKDVKDHYATLHEADPIFPCQLCDKVKLSIGLFRHDCLIY